MRLQDQVRLEVIISGLQFGVNVTLRIERERFQIAGVYIAPTLRFVGNRFRKLQCGGFYRVSATGDPEITEVRFTIQYLIGEHTLNHPAVQFGCVAPIIKREMSAGVGIDRAISRWITLHYNTTFVTARTPGTVIQMASR